MEQELRRSAAPTCTTAQWEAGVGLFCISSSPCWDKDDSAVFIIQGCCMCATGRVFRRNLRKQHVWSGFSLQWIIREVLPLMSQPRWIQLQFDKAETSNMSGINLNRSHSSHKRLVLECMKNLSSLLSLVSIGCHDINIKCKMCIQYEPKLANLFALQKLCIIIAHSGVVLLLWHCAG